MQQQTSPLYQIVIIIIFVQHYVLAEDHHRWCPQWGIIEGFKYEGLENERVS